jgi:hypothetical protein
MFELFGFVLPDWVVFIGGLIWLVLTILGTLFNIAMFFDALKRKFENKFKKYFWLFVNIIIPFASLVYFYLYKYKK